TSPHFKVADSKPSVGLQLISSSPNPTSDSVPSFSSQSLQKPSHHCNNNYTTYKNTTSIENNRTNYNIPVSPHYNRPAPLSPPFNAPRLSSIRMNKSPAQPARYIHSSFSEEDECSSNAEYQYKQQKQQQQQQTNAVPTTNSRDSMPLSLRHILSRSNILSVNNINSSNNGRRCVSHSYKDGSVPLSILHEKGSDGNGSAVANTPKSGLAKESSAIGNAGVTLTPSSSSSSSWISRLGRQTSHQFLKITSLHSNRHNNIASNASGKVENSKSSPSSGPRRSGVYSYTSSSTKNDTQSNAATLDGQTLCRSAGNSFAKSIITSGMDYTAAIDLADMECENISAYIVGTETWYEPTSGSESIGNTSGKKKFTVYKIQITAGSIDKPQIRWTVYRKYNEFSDLYLRLKQLYPETKISSFPPKRLLGGHFSSDFVFARRERLNSFVRAIMDDDTLRSCDTVRNFLRKQESDIVSAGSDAMVLAGLFNHSDNTSTLRGDEHAYASDYSPSDVDHRYTTNAVASQRNSTETPSSSLMSSLSSGDGLAVGQPKSVENNKKSILKPMESPGKRGNSSAPKTSRKKFGFRRNLQTRSAPFDSGDNKSSSASKSQKGGNAVYMDSFDNTLKRSSFMSIESITNGTGSTNFVRENIGRVTKSRYEPDVAVQSAKQAKWRQIAGKRFYKQLKSVLPAQHHDPENPGGNSMAQMYRSFSEDPRAKINNNDATSQVPASAGPVVTTHLMAAQKRARNDTLTDGYNLTNKQANVAGGSADADDHNSNDSTEDLDTKRVVTSPKSQKVSLDDFHLLSVIGKGSYGKVMLARHKDSANVYAIKVISKSKLISRPNEIRRVMSERRVLERAVEHPFLVGLHYAFQTRDKLYLCINYINGGELFFHLQRERRFPENRARFYAAEITSALGYLHSIDIVYRDLKPENCLLDARGHLRIVDFGLAKEIPNDIEDGKTSTFCGTPEYLAPEVIQRQSYGKEVDWYCLGAVLYEMLTGLPPFYTTDATEMYRRILYEPLRFPPHVGTLSRDFVTRLMERHPARRLGHGVLGTENIKAHMFYYGIDWGKVYRMEYQPPFIPDVSSIFDLSNIDPEFKNEPIPESILNEGAVNVLAEAEKNAATKKAQYNQEQRANEMSSFVGDNVPLYGANHIGMLPIAGGGATNAPFGQSVLTAFPSPLPTPGTPSFFSNKNNGTFNAHANENESFMYNNNNNTETEAQSQVESATNAFKGFSFVSPFAEDEDNNENENNNNFNDHHQYTQHHQH
ncbi:Serine/threonine-protein kinase Sgk2, partial [Mycoemilia scoparia]